MVDSKKFEALRPLHDECLAEAIREREKRLDAQLQVATARDQRALTILGFQVTAATAAIAGSTALFAGPRKDLILGILAMGLAFALIRAACLAMHSAHPGNFFLPGNEPENWLPQNWAISGIKRMTLKQARIEQAIALQEAIERNGDDNSARSETLHKSISIMLWTAIIVSICLAGILISRTWTIQEPTSEIVIK